MSMTQSLLSPGIVPLMAIIGAVQNRGVAIEAWKQERLRKKRVKALLRAGNLIPPEDWDLILDPETNSEPETSLEPEPGLELGFELESEPGFETGFESELEPEFEFELGPESQLAREL
ncbi:hypothetical protein VE00_02205 [Pseudogymnoascus sp. WSF 3629]|nr:hypothetical protein VE00_02205 [Pseudogymnoascus sp. WSF 3629]